MEDRYRRLFSKLPTIGAPIGLKGAILERVRLEERQAAQRGVFATVPVLLASFGGMVWGAIAAVQALSQSGFGHYVSLIFSDTGSIVSLWYPFALSIVESLPLFALTVLVGALLAFVSSAPYAARSARRAFSFV